MDHDQLLLAPYTPAQAQAQIDALPAAVRHAGLRWPRAMIGQYVAGVNAYIAPARTDPPLPAGRLRRRGTRRAPAALDRCRRVAVAGLIGGIFGKGGGTRDRQRPAADLPAEDPRARPPARPPSPSSRRRNDPLAPDHGDGQRSPTSTTARSTPRRRRSPTRPPSPAARSRPPPAAAARRPPATAPTGQAATATAIINGLKAMPVAHEQRARRRRRALGDRSPRRGLRPPGVLLRAADPDPDRPPLPRLRRGGRLLPRHRASSSSAAGRTTPGRPPRRAATSSTSGWRWICKPGGGTPMPRGRLLRVQRPVRADDARDVLRDGGAQAGRAGRAGRAEPRDLPDRATASCRAGRRRARQPVAVVNQRSTYNHEVDSVVGFLGWGRPAVTHDVASWMSSAATIQLHVQLALRRQPGHRLLRERPRPGPAGRRGPHRCPPGATAGRSGRASCPPPSTCTR